MASVVGPKGLRPGCSGRLTQMGLQGVSGWGWGVGVAGLGRGGGFGLPGLVWSKMRSGRVGVDPMGPGPMAVG